MVLVYIFKISEHELLHRNATWMAATLYIDTHVYTRNTSGLYHICNLIYQIFYIRNYKQYTMHISDIQVAYFFESLKPGWTWETSNVALICWPFCLVYRKRLTKCEPLWSFKLPQATCVQILNIFRLKQQKQNGRALWKALMVNKSIFATTHPITVLMHHHLSRKNDVYQTNQHDM